jgi:hypothetical protein
MRMFVRTVVRPCMLVFVFVVVVVVASVSRLAAPLAAQQSADASGARSVFYNPWTGTVLAGLPSTTSSSVTTVPVNPLVPPKDGVSATTKTDGAKPPPPAPASASAVRPVRVRPKTDAIPRSVGIHYWLDLDGVGPVADSRTFTTGERIRLFVRSNDDGYLAVWTAGSDGRLQLVLPVGGDPTGTPIKGGQEYVGHRVRFQPPAAEEQLFLAFARQKQDLPSFEVVTRPQGARDIVIETDEETAGEVGTYVINRRGGPIAKEIRLRHAAP